MSEATANPGVFLVTGGTGNVGREVARALTAAGELVRVASRHPTEAGAPPNVQTTTLDLENPESFAPALRGVRGLFLMRPPQIVRVGSTINRFLDAAVAAGVRNCVFLSVAGAEVSALIPHRAVELHLMKSSLAWTILRPGFFAQNLTGPYRSDIQAGSLILPAGHTPVAFVDAFDLGEAAAIALCNPEAHANRTYHLTGPVAVTFDEVAAKLSQALLRPIAYEAVNIARYWQHMRHQHETRFRTAILTMIHVGLRHGQGGVVDTTLSQILGRPARTIQEFILANLAAWR